MLLYKRGYILLLFLAALMVVGCNKKDIEGTEITPVTEAFQIEEDFKVSNSIPDFVKEAIYFTAEFSEEVTSVITIKGLESGAEKKIVVEKAASLDATNATWNGNNDGLYFFKTGEEVSYTLSFFGADLIVDSTLTIKKAYEFDVEGKVVIIQNGDFNDLPNWSNEWWVDNNASKNILDFDFGWYGIEETNVLPVQGDKFVQFYGTRTDTSAYIGGAAAGNRDAVYYDLPADPERVWVNIYAYGYGNSYTNNYLLCAESDKCESCDEVDEYTTKDGLTVLGSDNVIDKDQNLPGFDDALQWEIPSDHYGWKLFSVKYSRIPFADYCIPGKEGGGCGNGIREPNRIDMVAFSFESDDPTLPSHALIDQVIFTIDGPFNPSKL
jgi:hypothetical protein